MHMLPVPLGDTLQRLATLFGFSHEALQIEPVLAGQGPVLAALQDPIDLGLGPARAQGGLLALQARGLCPGQTLLGQTGLDGLGPAAEQQGYVTRHAGQLEGAVAARQNRVAELGGMCRQCLLVALAGLLGVDVEPVAPDAPPLLLAAAGGVHDHGMAVQLRLGGTRQIVPEHRRHHLPGGLLERLATMPCARDKRVLLQPAERLLDRGIVCGDQPLVATDKSREADTLRCGEGQIPAVPMLVLAIPDAAELGLGIDPALEQLLEPAGFDLTGKAQLLRPGTEPKRRPFLVLGVVIVLGEVAGGRHRRAHDSDRQHGSLLAFDRRSRGPGGGMAGGVAASDAGLVAVALLRVTATVAAD